METIKYINIDFSKKCYDDIIAKANDVNSRFIQFRMLDNQKAIDLTGIIPRVYFIKSDGTEGFNDLVVNDPVGGLAIMELTEQMLAEPGILKMELNLIKDNSRLSNIQFEVNVISSLTNAFSITSTNEWQALINALSSLSEYDSYKNEIKEARKGQLTLGDKIDLIDSSLDNKVSYIVSNNMIGIDDSDRIQKALDSNFPVNGTKIVVVEAKNKHNPDGIYYLSKPLKVPSNTCLKLEGCYLKLNNGVNNAIINNSDFDGGNKNIHIIGVGNPILDCNRNGQNLTLNNYKNIGLHLYNVDNFSIQGITLKDSARWCLVPEKCTNGLIDDINFDLAGEVNQDGVHILGQSSNITVTKIRGVVGDDACVVNARLNGQGTNVFQGYGTGGNVTNIVFDDINIKGGTNSHTGILRTSGSPTTVIDGIILSNAIGYNLYDGILRLGGNDDILIDNHRNISVSNVKGYEGTRGGVSLINMLQPIKNVQVSNAQIFTTRKRLINGNGKNIDNLQLSNVYMEIQGTEEESTTVKSIFGFANSTVNGLQATNIKVKYNEISSLSYSYIFDLSNATLKNTIIQGIEAKHVRNCIKNSSTTVERVRIDTMCIDGDYYKLGFTREDNFGIIVNGFALEDGTTELPTKNIYQVGDIVSYRNTTITPTVYNWYIMNNEGSFKIIPSDWKKTIFTDGEKFLNIDLGTIEPKDYKTVVIPVPGSLTGHFYQLKPGFDLPAGFIYSYTNRVANELKLTVFNATSTSKTFSTSEQTWIAIKTVSAI